MRAAGANFASANCVPVGCPGRRRQLLQLAGVSWEGTSLKDSALFAGHDVQHALALRARWRVSPLLASHDAEDWLDDAGASIWHEGRLLTPNAPLGL